MSGWDDPSIILSGSACLATSISHWTFISVEINDKKTIKYFGLRTHMIQLSIRFGEIPQSTPKYYNDISCTLYLLNSLQNKTTLMLVISMIKFKGHYLILIWQNWRRGVLICHRYVHFSLFCIWSLKKLYQKRLRTTHVLRCIHHFKLDLINNMDHMHISGT